jgi:Uma2 family endonuclease
MPSSLSDSGVVLPELQLRGTDLVRLSVKQYHDLARAGILQDNQVELLEGLLVRKMTKNRAHSLSTRKARGLLEAVIPAGAYVDSQEPITTLESEPEPDGIVVKGRPEDYPDRHPSPNEVLIVIEVADASLPRDRGWKLKIYARAAIAVYWIINLVERHVEVYSGPTGPTDTPAYAVKAVFKPGEDVPVVLDGREVGRVAVVGLLS